MSTIVKSDYRPDIDGLRAIAVLSVVLHHLSPTLLPGGFIGVDIFFVISGFLITSHIYKEVLEKKFTIKRFYKRRINRIVPALVTVLIVTLTVGVILLSPTDLIRLVRSAIYSVFGVSNVFFWRDYGNYFNANSAEAPLLHTWSLGVEEQFYVVWPFIVMLLVKLNRRLLVIIGVTALLTLGAIAVSQIAATTVASASYFLLPTRFFELMIGGLLAFILSQEHKHSRTYSTLSYMIGFMLIGGSLFWLNNSSIFPGLNAVWPCLGAALIIWAGKHHGKATRILTNRPIVFIGLISYSLYLWHWPIIAYLNYINVAITPVIGTALVFSSIFLAWLSWKYVEIPMRRSGIELSFGQVFTRRFVVPAMLVLAVTGLTIFSKGFPQRFDAHVADFEVALTAQPELLRSGCHVPTALYNTSPDTNKCRLGAKKDQLDGILIGDSLANHFTGMVDVMAKTENLAIMDFTMDGCPPILGYDTGKAPAYVEKCIKRNEVAYALAAKKQKVILAGNWPDEPNVGKLVMASIDKLLSAGASITMIIKNQSIEHADNCVIRNLMYHRAQDCSGELQDAPYYFKEIHQKYPQVSFIEPNAVICKGKKCSPIVDDTLLYRDSLHLNDIGSRLIGENLLRMGVKI